MKKNLLTLGLLASISAHSQVLTYVGDQALVTVQDQALVYSGGGWQNVGTGTVNNTGDIMVVGDPTKTSNKDIFNVAASADFRLVYSTSSIYGQLYIQDVAQGDISGVVSKEYKADGNTGSTGRQQIALPFYNFNMASIKSVLDPSATWLNTTNTALNSTGRFNYASLFKWNNKAARFDQLTDANSSTKVGEPTDYYILPRRNSAGTVQWDAVNTLKTFKGIPVSDISGQTQGADGNGIDLFISLISSYGVNGNAKNYYYERYNSYLNDPFAVGGGTTTTWSTYYGKRLSQFANPFLTNIDLYNIVGSSDADGDGNALSNVEGVAYYGASDLNWYYNQGGTGNYTGTAYSNGNLVMAKTSGGVFQSGDANKLLIKPMQEVMIKFTNDNTGKLKFNKTRRFAQTARTSSPYSVTAARGISSIPAEYLVRQVAVVLYNASGDEVGRTYYAVSPSATSGYSTNSALQGYVDNYSIYTKEELTTGGEDASQIQQLYINEANEIDFQGKKIPMYINFTDPATVKFELYEGGQRVAPGSELTNGKSFYIEKDNVITKINDGDTLPVVGNSYGLYYEKPSGVLAANGAIKDQTIVAKKDSDWVVRFAKNWKSANIEIYTSAGQLLYSNKKVLTSTDFVLPINNQVSGLYLVKAISETGETVIKKIVK